MSKVIPWSADLLTTQAGAVEYLRCIGVVDITAYHPVEGTVVLKGKKGKRWIMATIRDKSYDEGRAELAEAAIRPSTLHYRNQCTRYKEMVKHVPVDFVAEKWFSLDVADDHVIRQIVRNGGDCEARAYHGVDGICLILTINYKHTEYLVYLENMENNIDVNYLWGK